MDLSNDQLKRYSRHIMMHQLDYEGQVKLLQSHALIIGAGGLGSPVAMYLASSGVGEITLVDFDKVEVSNLQRQIMHGTPDIGRPKVDSARDRLLAINPDVKINTISHAMEEEELREQVRRADVVVDTTDNFTTRFAVNAACVHERKPLISGSVIRMEGQMTVFRNDKLDGPCYRCLYKDSGELGETCTQSGVLAPVVGIIGAIQATETLKVLTGLGQDLSGRLLLVDAFTMEMRELKLRKDPACPVCGSAH
ncbi:MAG: molybdopterin-synthase adenylyltransferase MoeB [Gammaproteobacteria bacterium]|nr:molybdopterin-synthase adenylyltransferase MoeB [Gammaproteobacteria bacterium]